MEIHKEASVLDEATLMKVFEHVLSGDRKRQHEAVEQYFTEDIEFNHPLGKVEGRDGFYGK
jgi:hypothetical protein